MIKMIVFDMAGTTVNENMVVYKTLMKVINDAGFRIDFDQVITQGAGKEKMQAIKDILRVYANNTDAGLQNDIYQNFMGMLEAAYRKLEISAMPGSEDLFGQLKQRDIKVVLNTGYNRETATSLIKKLGWSEGNQIDLLVTASDVPNNRPKPDMIMLAVEKFGFPDASEVIKVGDSIIDIEEGVNAGCCLSIGVTTGAHNREQLESIHPDHVIDNLLELVEIVDNY